MPGRRQIPLLAAPAVSAALLLGACGGDGGVGDVAACGSDPGEDAVQVTFRMITPPRDPITADEAERTVEVLCERAEALNAEAVIERSSEFELEVLLSGEGAARAAELIGAPAKLGFYDWELALIPDPNAPPDRRFETPFPGPYEAVRLASGLPPDCAEERCTVPGPTSYLFDLASKELIDGPSLAVEGLLDGRLQGEEPGGFELLSVRVGTIVLRERDSDAYWVLRDRPVVTADQIADPEVTTDPATGQPAVLVHFTDEGKLAFRRLTRKIAERATPPSVFGVALDLELIALPDVDPVGDRTGRDPEDGFVITGDFTEQQAGELASFLEIGSPPVGLAPIG
jgi:preprotein translocase subunit SecD